MTPELILAILTAAFSLACDLLPWFSDRWAGLETETKRWIWLGGCVVIPLSLWLLCCVGGVPLFKFEWQCDADGLVSMLLLALVAYGSGQIPHSIVKSVKNLKA